MAGNEFDELIAFCEYAIQYCDAVEAGVELFVRYLPTMIRNHMKVLAQQRLHGTKDRFLDSIKFQGDGEVLIVTMDKDWLALAVETGCDPFDIKVGILNSPKAKISKQGFKYRVVPMGPLTKNAPGSNTEKGQLYQGLIRETLNRPKYGKSKTKLQMDGTVSVIREIVAKDDKMKGMYRIDTYANNIAKESGQKPLSSKNVLFRVVSEKRPEAFLHPGIKPANIFKDTEAYINAVAPDMLAKFIDDEVKSIK
jgi:hypothetical protein